MQLKFKGDTMKKRKKKSKKKNSDIKVEKEKKDSPEDTMEQTDKIVRRISTTKYTGMGK